MISSGSIWLAAVPCTYQLRNLDPIDSATIDHTGQRRHSLWQHAFKPLNSAAALALCVFQDKSMPRITHR
jgi:hypothetical protein